ncbi:E3 SUMO-protein ligase pli1 [Tolypocladium ophioglossoides CBS 100239]|uniref:E3 SUMO-protein ligase pli1 n=1 Tax=Tolypocladium ophioglossoides (strain CBS 100239) TaxID=1163406 RepID=A0A0L0NCM7_TOLOC|nr:E3 SUMO-protein ligase pli1 [Tolypocladium ophioglossoides CBS 100239]
MASPVSPISRSPISRQDVSALLRQVQGNQLFNRQLSSVCQVNGLKSTGVKAELQRRIVDLIQETVNANDVLRFHQVRQSIVNAFAQRSSPSSKGAAARSSNSSSSHSSMPAQFATPMPSYNNGGDAYHSRGYTRPPNGHGPSTSYGASIQSLTFRPSPFYQVDTPVSTLRHRNAINISIKLNDNPILLRCVDDKSYRVIVFCAGDPSGVQDVAFPHQSELKVNGGDIKANLRGLKNKPGSTRPVDITHALRLKPQYINNVEFTYALTNKKFYLVAYLCKTTSVSELVSTVSTRRRIPKELVVRDLNKKAQDPDVVATSQVLSLKCPLSYMRLDVPCRSLACTHIQCFDATSYLQLQEQGPQWLCPICNKSAPFEQLAVDEYVRDILENTPKDLETVTIEPNGRWSKKPTQDDRPSTANEASLDEDDDLVEISEANAFGSRRMETPKTITPSVSTPISGGRDGSASAPRGFASTSAKRPAPAVIDLTADSDDDDDDDEPIQRPHKRQSTAANGVRDSNSLGFLSESPTGHKP